MPMASLVVETPKDTQFAARSLAKNLPDFQFPPMLLHGPVGAGKTTFARFLVNCLDGAENAEVTSPSFTIYNIYPTCPLVYHCDLYRCGDKIPEEIFEALDKKGALVIVEWSNYLNFQDLPMEFLDINFILDNDRRLIEFTPKGSMAENIIKGLLKDWQSHINS